MCAAVSGNTLEFSLNSGYNLIVGSKKYPLSENQYHLLCRTDRVPEGTILALGDNPAQSVDSRAYGFVPEKNVIGKVHPKILEIFDINTDVYYLDIDIRKTLKLIKERAKKLKLKDIGKYPAVFRDLALVCDNNIEFSKVIKAINKFNDIIQKA